MFIWILAQFIWICRSFVEWVDSWERLPSGYTPREEALLHEAENNWWNWFYLGAIFLLGFLACCEAIRMCINCICPCILKFERGKIKTKKQR